MVDATISRGGTSVSLPLVSDSSGDPIAIRTLGKPNLEIQQTGSILPRHIDQWSGLLQYNLLGRLMGSSAYDDAITLADLIKSNSNGTELTLDIPLDEYDDTIRVAPAAGQDEALSLAYEPGRKNQVDVDIGLTRIEQTLSGGNQPANTPTTSGSGPIQLTNGSTTVDLSTDVTVSRGVGRPQSVVRRAPNQNYPNHIDKFKGATDKIELGFEFVDNVVSQTNDIARLFQGQLGRDSLTLDFQGLYGLGAFSVVPDGSNAMRLNRPAGEQGTTVVPSVNLVRVL